MEKCHSSKVLRSGNGKMRKGSHLTQQHKDRLSSYWKGYKRTEQNKHNISLGMKGIKFTKEHKQAISLAKKGKILTEEHKEKIGIAMKGKNKGYKSWKYIDGRSYNRSPARYGDDWSKIRLLIYARDNFTCQKCALTMIKSLEILKCPLHIHHKIPFLISHDNSLNNLITLCASCHGIEESRISKKTRKEAIIC